jgi:hypothetical protein
MAGHLNDVLFAVSAPDTVLKGGLDEMLAVIYKNDSKLLVVVNKETETDGFIITAYFTKKADKLLKRSRLWEK